VLTTPPSTLKEAGFVIWFDDESGVIYLRLAHLPAVEREAPQKAKAA